MISRAVPSFSAFAILLGACGGATSTTASSPAAAPTPQPTRAGEASAEKVRTIDELMARENPPVPKRPIALFGGLVTGAIEATAEVQPECEPVESGKLSTCAFSTNLGKIGEESYDLMCMVGTDVVTFGAQVRVLLEDDGELTETPALDVISRAGGLMATFVGNMRTANGDVGTAKVAALYADGYTIVCSDRRPGGRKTFSRVAGDFFDSLKRKPRPLAPTAYLDYRRRTGDRVSGFRHKLVQPTDEGGIGELSVSFNLEANGSTWDMWDHSTWIVRDENDTIESIRASQWARNGASAVVTAKPGEGKKYRLKFESGDTKHSVEVTPRAPLNSEWGAAADLLALSTGAAKSKRYAVLSVDDEGDPTFNYLTLERTKPGVIAEREEPHAKPKKGAAVAPPDELTVNARGVVTKEVTPTNVTELLEARGTRTNAKGKRK